MLLDSLAAVAVILFYLWYGNRHDFFDLHIYHDAMTWWSNGNRLYEFSVPDRLQGRLYFTYTPFAAFVMRPMAFVPFTGVAVAFAVLSVIAAYGAVYCLLNLSGVIKERAAASVLILTGLVAPLTLLIEPMRETLTLGQINMPLVCLVLFDICYAVPRGWRAAGAFIGIATAIKLIPGIFILYLLIAKQWRAAAVATATTAIATLLAFLASPSTSREYWTSAFWDTARVGGLEYPGNQSILGLMSRVAAPETANRGIWLVSVAALLAIGLFRAYRAQQSGNSLAAIALVGLIGGLISPITWPHHIYWLVPAMLVLLEKSIRGTHRARLAATVALLLTFAASVRGVVSFSRWDGVHLAQSLVPFVNQNLLVIVTAALVLFLPVMPAGLPRRPDISGPGRSERPGPVAADRL
ncbi:glycosyltransferase 87 family protein [Micromonospora sp. NPDC047707]|uniref:glycosyltransferase 87 family protein n=1 Tax=unclassified Micromonospora TaxID=2617518 RepID=UPI0012B45245|nr:glycosyltransferase 87 family protein [Micromonospora sp. WMMC415]QGN45625.1 DUF2029 domain-containing protein [Micromonospora sp. WMMC415]